MFMKSALAAGVLALGLVASSPAAAQVSQLCMAGSNVTIGSSTLCGIASPVSTPEPVYAYEGIRYGTAMRWSAPVAAPLPATLNATQFGNVCPQIVAKQFIGSEDCLFLNVWVPQSAIASPPATKLPVMVFIHGGAFVQGAGSSGLYNGSAFASQGAVVVTLNYRLGALGFLVANTLGSNAGGNFGIQDQQLAMTWVKNNVAAFGGDPNRITLFGESAGAMSVGLHTFDIPSSQNLFAAAIMESNPAGVIYRTPSASLGMGNQYLAYLCATYGSGPQAKPATRRAKPAKPGKHLKDSTTCNGNADFLANVTPEQIATAQGAFLKMSDAQLIEAIISGSIGLQNLPWEPVVDGNLILGEPYNGYAPGVTTFKPLAFGTNLNEGAVFLAMAYGKAVNYLTPVNYASFITTKFGAAVLGRLEALDIDHGRYDPSKQSVPSDQIYENATSSAMANLLTDYAFTCGNLAIANSAQAQMTAANNVQPIYDYQFTQPNFFDLYNLAAPVAVASDAADLGGCDPGLNVCHAHELTYVFSSFGFITGANPGYVPTANDTAVTGGMNAAWFAFANNPASAGSSWPLYSDGAAALWNGSKTPGSVNLDSFANCSSLWLNQGPYAATSVTRKPVKGKPAPHAHRAAPHAHH